MDYYLQDKLRHTKEDLLEISQQVGGIGSWVYIWQTQECFWSRSTYDFFGVKPGTKIDADFFFGFVHPEDRRLEQENFLRIFVEGVYSSVHRIQVGGRVRWIEESGKLFECKESGFTYVVGSLHDITTIKLQQQRIDDLRSSYSVINSYLAESTNTTDLQCITNNIQRTVTRKLDVPLIALFTNVEGVFNRVVPEGTPHAEVFLQIRQEDSVAFKTIQTGRRQFVPLEEIPDKRAAQVLLSMGGKTFLSMPVRSDGEVIAALNLILKTEVLESSTLSFASTICGYLSAQVKNAILYQRLKEELAERERMQTRTLELEKSMEMEKLNTEFFANLSHEFKTPLNVILSTLELLEVKGQKQVGGTISLEEESKFLEYIRQNTYRLLSLTTNLLDATKLDHGFYRPDFGRYDLVKTISYLTKMVEPYMVQKELTLTYLSEIWESPYAVFDRDKVERVILNLLSNAAKNTPAGGTITLSLSEDDDTFIIAVKDTGMGIEPEHLASIFERFRVVESGFIKPCEGSGLGLSIAKALVEMHEGKIWVESTPGEGSSFSFTISKHLQPVKEGELPQEFGGSELRSNRVQMEFAD